MTGSGDNDLRLMFLLRGPERYILLFDDEVARADALLTLRRWASNPELSFTWYDAAMLSERIRSAQQNTRLPT